MSFQADNKPSFPIKLFGLFKSFEQSFSKITEGRKKKLVQLATHISDQLKSREEAEIIVICTHNSRRSHLGQIMLKAATIYYGIPNVRVYSGGTEATAFYPSAVKALFDVGFNIQKTTDSENPVYECAIGQEGPVLVLFSKKYDHENNPSKDFIALMVCTDADEACPIVTGATARMAIPYKDPKAYDGTDQEAAKYDERCRQIGREMFYVMQQVKNNK